MNLRTSGFQVYVWKAGRDPPAQAFCVHAARNWFAQGPGTDLQQAGCAQAARWRRIEMPHCQASDILARVRELGHYTEFNELDDETEAHLRQQLRDSFQSPSRSRRAHIRSRSPHR
jgi:hypothetical protein